MKIGYILLIAFIGYVALKYYTLTVSVQQNQQNRLIARPGVSYYCDIAFSNTTDQLRAFRQTSPCQSTQLGYAPPLGPQENNYGVTSIVI